MAGKFLNGVQNALTALSAPLQFVGNLVQQRNANRQAEKQMQFSREMMNAQNDWNLQMFNLTNDYNSPVNERARLEAAGINPLQIQSDAGVASSIQSAGALGYQAPASYNPFAGVSDAALNRARLENIQADTAKKNNENITETQRRENMKVQLQKDKQDIENMVAGKKLTEAQTAQVNKALEWIDRINSTDVSYKKALIELTASQRNRIDELLDGEKLLQSKTLEDFERRWSKIEAEISKIAKDTELSELDIQNYALNHAQNGIKGSGLSFPNMIRAGLAIAPKVKSFSGAFSRSNGGAR